MRTGVNLMLWTGCYTAKDTKLIDRVAKMGFDGVEFPIFDPKAVDIKGTRQALKDNGLGATVCTVIVAGSLISPGAKDRKAALKHVCRTLEVSKAIGADCVAGPIYSPVGLLVGRGPPAAEKSQAVKSLKLVARAAEDIGIDVGIEPINRFETYFVNTTADALSLCKKVGSSRMGVHYDTFHANIEEKDPVAALRSIGRNWLKHVHPSENDRGIPGSGHVPWKETINTLKAMKYNGWVTIESFIPAIKELARAASIWRPLASSGDELAIKGLQFLRRCGV